jgi:hypothetical protein
VSAWTPGPLGVFDGVLVNGGEIRVFVQPLSARTEFGKITAEIPTDTYPRETQVANAKLYAAAPDLLAAAKLALQFIENGCELGYIRMPDADTPDAAHATPWILHTAIDRAEGR